MQLWLSSVVYDGKGTLEEGETAEARFIKIQAAYELLMDSEKKRQYDMDNRVNPMKVCKYKNYKLGIFFFSLEILRVGCCWVCVGISSLDGMVDKKA